MDAEEAARDSRRLGVTLCSSVAVAASTATAGAQTQIPPSVEFSVPKPPTVALSDSGAFLSYELHVTNLTPAAMYLRRVEVLDANSHASVFTLADSALIRALTRVAPPTCRATDTTSRPAVECLPASERAQIPAGVRAYVYLWIPVDANHPPAKLSHRLTFKRTGADSSDVVLEGTTIPSRPTSRSSRRRSTESGRRSTARPTRRDTGASCSDSTDTRRSANGSRSISSSSIRPAARTTAIRSRTRTTTRTVRR